MTAQRWLLTATLSRGSDIAALLRVVSILHSRHIAVDTLAFDSAAGSVSADLRPGPTDMDTIRWSLLRSVDVIDVVLVISEPTGLRAHSTS